MIVDIVNKSDFYLPKYETDGSAGMDLRADLKRYYIEQSEQHKIDIYSESLVISPFKVYKIPTGIFVSLPKVKAQYPAGSIAPLVCDDFEKEYELQIRPRSGLAAKHGITLMNSPGTVDQSYRGEICVLLIKLTEGDYTITHGDRIAQMIFGKVEKVTWNEVTELDHTERGMGGFGHTGK